LTSLGTTMLVKNAGMTAANKVIADLLAGSSEAALEPSGNAGNAKDKNDTKSYGSVAATKFLKNKYIMEKYSIVPNLIAFTANGSSASIPYATPAGGITSAYVPETNQSKAQGYTSAIKKLF